MLKVHANNAVQISALELATAATGSRRGWMPGRAKGYTKSSDLPLFCIVLMQVPADWITSSSSKPTTRFVADYLKISLS